MNIKILIIIIVLIGLGIGGVFVWKNISGPEEGVEVSPVVEKELEKEGILPIPESALKSKFGYMAHHGDWQILEEERERYSYLSWERGHPGFANWQEIEPREGNYHWEQIDRYVETAQEKDIQILFTVWPFTDWDQERCNLHHEWQPNDWGKDPRDFLSFAHRKGKPCDMEAYQEFLRLLVERYDGDGQGDMPGLRYPVRYWEIGNEPDGAYDPKVGGLFFQGSVEDYFEILRVSYTTIKETDQNSMVLIAAIPSLGIYGEIPEWVRPDFNPIELFELGASRYFDIMNLHESGRNEKLRDIFKRYGAGDKPIWITEPWAIGEYIRRAEEENIALATLFKEEFEKEFQYGVERIFLGGPESIDQALYEAVLTTETPEEKEEEKKEEETEKKEGEEKEEEQKGPIQIFNQNISGEIKQDQIWNGTIHVTGDVTVVEGVTLTILPGTVIKVALTDDQHKGNDEPITDPYFPKDPPFYEKEKITIYMGGILNAVGTADSMIIFTSDSENPTTYDWRGLDIVHGRLEYAIVEYAQGNIQIQHTSDVVISNSIVRNSLTCCICIGHSNQLSPQILNNDVYNCGHETIDYAGGSALIKGNYFHRENPEIQPDPSRGENGVIIYTNTYPIIENNIFKNLTNAITFLGHSKYPAEPGKNIMIKNNRIENNDVAFNIAPNYPFDIVIMENNQLINNKQNEAYTK